MKDMSTEAMKEIKGLTRETRFFIVKEFTDICQKFMLAIEGKDIEALKDELWKVTTTMRSLIP